MLLRAGAEFFGKGRRGKKALIQPLLMQAMKSTSILASQTEGVKYVLRLTPIVVSQQITWPASLRKLILNPTAFWLSL